MLGKKRGIMTTRKDVEMVRELPQVLPPGWQWRPQMVEDGEAQRLLQRYAQRGLPDSARHDVMDSAADILARCVPPSEQKDGQETGIVVGYVQSGKTLSFTTVAALACDNRFPLVIVLSGTKRNLYSQTVKRLQRDLDLEHPAGRWVLFEAQTSNPDLPQQLKHLLEQWDRPELPGFPRKTAIIAVLKNRRRVDGLVDALRQLDLRGRPCLVIDDEADQYGLNTKIRKGGTSPVYGALLSLREALPQHSYVQYTATPQALLLISVLDSLSPRFGRVLSAGAGYCGGRDFFGQDGGKLVRTIADRDLEAVDDESDDGPPDSLLEALRLFYVGVAAQAVCRGRKEPTQQFRSMLVHPSMHQIDHLRFKRWVDNATDSWIELLESDRSVPDHNELVSDFRFAYDELASSTATHLEENRLHETVPAFDDILLYLPHAMRDTRTWEVNSRVLEQWTQENWQAASSHILVGGENLGRGFTVEGLTATYMPRGRGTGVADTIQQRGRFFGYKRNYLGLCRVFLASDVRSDYEHYIDHESYVMDQLGQLAQSGKPMSEWRRRMLLAHSLRPTRPSVLPDIYRHRRVSEWTQQAQPWTRDDDAQVEANWKLIETLLEGLPFEEDPGSDERTREQRNALAKHVPLVRVLQELLVPMSFSWRDAPDFSVVELAIQWHLKENPGATASVYRMAAYRELLPGGGTRRRQVNDDGRLANLFQGAAPVEPARLRGSVYPGDLRVHAAEAVTVQIHDLDLTDSSRRFMRGHVPAIAVWVPNSLRVGVFDEMAT
ncbi:MAG: hypothetical protein F4W96_04370 [Chloroflexi bacterium]|nr:hypothetical protein [Chloroflexota bacterium]